MYSTRYTLGQPTAARKSKVEGNKLSMLPKPRRSASMDRASDARRGSHRSSSADPPRAGGPRLSRDASASKIPMNRKSKSQLNMNERYGHGSAITPLRNSAYSRVTTTPVRTPSQDGGGRSWHACVERALAFVTCKDQRPLSEPAWQRAEHARVQAVLAARGEGAAGGALTLIRPLTITRFVDICGGLLNAACGAKINNDNYVAKLPNLAKRFLYPGAVSKSWLKTVNTLHAFPQALAIIAYFLDLVEHIESPVSEEWLHRDKDEISCLRREYLAQCWMLFDDTHSDFEGLQDEYLARVRQLLGDDEQRIRALSQDNEELEAAINDESEVAARAEEERLKSRRDVLAAAVRGLKIESRGLRDQVEDETARDRDLAATLKGLDADIAKDTNEIEQLKLELESQTMTVNERAQLLADAQYTARVQDSKLSLADQLAKMVESKEQELTEWQQRALDSCLQYKRALIHLAAKHPQLAAAIAVDEKELMEESCATILIGAVEKLRALLIETKALKEENERARVARHIQFASLLQKARSSVSELKTIIERERALAADESARDTADVTKWRTQREQLCDRLRSLEERGGCDVTRVEKELDYWETQDVLWRRKLSEMQEYKESKREGLARRLESYKISSADEVMATIAEWHKLLDDIRIKQDS